MSTFTVDLARLNSNERWGISLALNNENNVLISSIANNSPASSSILRQNDIIVSFDGNKLQGKQIEIVRQMFRTRTKIKLEIYRPSTHSSTQTATQPSSQPSIPTIQPSNASIMTPNPSIMASNPPIIPSMHNNSYIHMANQNIMPPQLLATFNEIVRSGNINIMGNNMNNNNNNNSNVQAIDLFSTSFNSFNPSPSFSFVEGSTSNSTSNNRSNNNQIEVINLISDDEDDVVVQKPSDRLQDSSKRFSLAVTKIPQVKQEFPPVKFGEADVEGEIMEVHADNDLRKRTNEDRDETVKKNDDDIEIIDEKDIKKQKYEELKKMEEEFDEDAEDIVFMGGNVATIDNMPHIHDQCPLHKYRRLSNSERSMQFHRITRQNFYIKKKKIFSYYQLFLKKNYPQKKFISYTSTPTPEEEITLNYSTSLSFLCNTSKYISNHLLKISKPEKVKSNDIIPNLACCDFCYCYVCDIKAKNCKFWNLHCNLTSDYCNRYHINEKKDIFSQSILKYLTPTKKIQMILTFPNSLQSRSENFMDLFNIRISSHSLSNSNTRLVLLGKLTYALYNNRQLSYNSYLFLVFCFIKFLSTDRSLFYTYQGKTLSFAFLFYHSLCFLLLHPYATTEIRDLILREISRSLNVSGLDARSLENATFFDIQNYLCSNSIRFFIRFLIHSMKENTIKSPSVDITSISPFFTNPNQSSSLFHLPTVTAIYPDSTRHLISKSYQNLIISCYNTTTSTISSTSNSVNLTIFSCDIIKKLVYEFSTHYQQYNSFSSLYPFSVSNPRIPNSRYLNSYVIIEEYIRKLLSNFSFQHINLFNQFFHDHFSNSINFYPLLLLENRNYFPNNKVVFNTEEDELETLYDLEKEKKKNELETENISINKKISEFLSLNTTKIIYYHNFFYFHQYSISFFENYQLSFPNNSNLDSAKIEEMRNTINRFDPFLSTLFLAQYFESLNSVKQKNLTTLTFFSVNLLNNLLQLLVKNYSNNLFYNNDDLFNISEDFLISTSSSSSPNSSSELHENSLVNKFLVKFFQNDLPLHLQSLLPELSTFLAENNPDSVNSTVPFDCANLFSPSSTSSISSPSKEELSTYPFYFFLINQVLNKNDAFSLEKMITFVGILTLFLFQKNSLSSLLPEYLKKNSLTPFLPFSFYSSLNLPIVASSQVTHLFLLSLSFAFINNPTYYNQISSFELFKFSNASYITLITHLYQDFLYLEEKLTKTLEVEEEKFQRKQSQSSNEEILFPEDQQNEDQFNSYEEIEDLKKERENNFKKNKKNYLSISSFSSNSISFFRLRLFLSYLHPDFVAFSFSLPILFDHTDPVINQSSSDSEGNLVQIYKLRIMSGSFYPNILEKKFNKIEIKNNLEQLEDYELEPNVHLKPPYISVYLPSEYPINYWEMILSSSEKKSSPMTSFFELVMDASDGLDDYYDDLTTYMISSYFSLKISYNFIFLRFLYFFKDCSSHFTLNKSSNPDFFSIFTLKGELLFLIWRSIWEVISSKMLLDHNSEIFQFLKSLSITLNYYDLDNSSILKEYSFRDKCYIYALFSVLEIITIFINFLSSPEESEEESNYSKSRQILNNLLNKIHEFSEEHDGIIENSDKEKNDIKYYQIKSELFMISFFPYKNIDDKSVDEKRINFYVLKFFSYFLWKNIIPPQRDFFSFFFFSLSNNNFKAIENLFKADYLIVSTGDLSIKKQKNKDLIMRILVILSKNDVDMLDWNEELNFVNEESKDNQSFIELYNNNLISLKDILMNQIELLDSNDSDVIFNILNNLSKLSSSSLFIRTFYFLDLSKIEFFLKKNLSLVFYLYYSFYLLFLSPQSSSKTLLNSFDTLKISPQSLTFTSHELSSSQLFILHELEKNQLNFNEFQVILGIYENLTVKTYDTYLSKLKTSENGINYLNNLHSLLSIYMKTNIQNSVSLLHPILIISNSSPNWYMIISNPIQLSKLFQNNGKDVNNYNTNSQDDIIIRYKNSVSISSNPPSPKDSVSNFLSSEFFFLNCVQDTNEISTFHFISNNLIELTNLLVELYLYSPFYLLESLIKSTEVYLIYLFTNNFISFSPKLLFEKVMNRLTFALELIDKGQLAFESKITISFVLFYYYYDQKSLKKLLSSFSEQLEKTPHNTKDYESQRSLFLHNKSKLNHVISFYNKTDRVNFLIHHMVNISHHGFLSWISLLKNDLDNEENKNTKLSSQAQDLITLLIEEFSGFFSDNFKELMKNGDYFAVNNSKIEHKGKKIKLKLIFKKIIYCIIRLIVLSKKCSISLLTLIKSHFQEKHIQSLYEDEIHLLEDLEFDEKTQESKIDEKIRNYMLETNSYDYQDEVEEQVIGGEERKDIEFKSLKRLFYCNHFNYLFFLSLVNPSLINDIIKKIFKNPFFNPYKESVFLIWKTSCSVPQIPIHFLYLLKDFEGLFDYLREQSINSKNISEKQVEKEINLKNITKHLESLLELIDTSFNQAKQGENENLSKQDSRKILFSIFINLDSFPTSHDHSDFSLINHHSNFFDLSLLDQIIYLIISPHSFFFHFFNFSLELQLIGLHLQNVKKLIYYHDQYLQTMKKILFKVVKLFDLEEEDKNLDNVLKKYCVSFYDYQKVFSEFFAVIYYRVINSAYYNQDNIVDKRDMKSVHALYPVHSNELFSYYSANLFSLPGRLPYRVYDLLEFIKYFLQFFNLFHSMNTNPLSISLNQYGNHPSNNSLVHENNMILNLKFFSNEEVFCPRYIKLTKFQLNIFNIFELICCETSQSSSNPVYIFNHSQCSSLFNNFIKDNSIRDKIININSFSIHQCVGLLDHVFLEIIWRNIEILEARDPANYHLIPYFSTSSTPASSSYVSKPSNGLLKFSSLPLSLSSTIDDQSFRYIYNTDYLSHSAPQVQNLEASFVPSFNRQVFQSCINDISSTYNLITFFSKPFSNFMNPNQSFTSSFSQSFNNFFQFLRVFVRTDLLGDEILNAYKKNITIPFYSLISIKIILHVLNFSVLKNYTILFDSLDKNGPLTTVQTAPQSNSYYNSINSIYFNIDLLFHFVLKFKNLLPSSTFLYQKLFYLLQFVPKLNYSESNIIPNFLHSFPVGSQNTSFYTQFSSSSSKFEYSLFPHINNITSMIFNNAQMPSSYTFSYFKTLNRNDEEIEKTKLIKNTNFLINSNLSFSSFLEQYNSSSISLSSYIKDPNSKQTGPLFEIPIPPNPLTFCYESLIHVELLGIHPIILNALQLHPSSLWINGLSQKIQLLTEFAQNYNSQTLPTFYFNPTTSNNLIPSPSQLYFHSHSIYSDSPDNVKNGTHHMLTSIDALSPSNTKIYDQQLFKIIDIIVTSYFNFLGILLRNNTVDATLRSNLQITLSKLSNLLTLLKTKFDYYKGEELKTYLKNKVKTKRAVVNIINDYLIF